MTGALTPAIDARLDEVRDICRAQATAEHARRLLPPLIRIWDGDFEQCFVVGDYLEATWPLALNEPTEGQLILAHDHPVAEWILNHWRRRTRNVMVTVDKDGARWGGMLDRYTLAKDDKGNRTLTLFFTEDLAQLADILVWPNPFMPATGPQWPKYFTLAGPSRYTLKLALFLNLLRLSGNLWALPDDPLDPATWVEGITPWTWPILVAPGTVLGDGSQWCIFDARMDPWLEIAAPVLADAQLMITTRRWLEGDPPPWPGAIMRQGQLVVDIVDKSGVWDQTSTGGTVFGGLARTVTSHADNFVDEIINTVVNPTEPAEYSVSKWLGTAPAQPWVIYHDGEQSGVAAAEYTWQQEGPVQMTAGGQSAPGVNEAQSLAIKLTGNILGSIFRFDTLGDIVDTAVAPLYEDVWLAFMTHKSILRTSRQGSFYRHERFVDGADRAFVLSSVLAFRRGFWETRGHPTFTLEVSDGAPYLIGANGHGHFFLGDRIGATLKGLPPGRVIVEQVHALELHCARGDTHWTITCGDPRPTESPWDRGLRRIRAVTQSLHRHNVL